MKSPRVMSDWTHSLLWRNHENSVNLLCYVTKHLIMDQPGIRHLFHVKGPMPQTALGSHLHSVQDQKKKTKKDPSLLAPAETSQRRTLTGPGWMDASLYCQSTTSLTKGKVWKGANLKMRTNPTPEGCQLIERL